MAAFDLTTKPTSLSLKPGSTGTIIVTISNRLGRPVMGAVEGTLTPASAARWLVQPPELQRRYEADAAATVNYEFKITVPENAPKQTAQFKASVRDVLAPDDTRVEGQTVTVNVTPEPVVVDGGRKGIPWWVWVIAGVVILGAGFGIYMAVRPKGVPNVVGMMADKATTKLTEAGFAPIEVKYTASAKAKDSTVASQEPEAKSALPPDSLKGKTKATIVVNRPPTVVPAIVNQSLALAIERLREAGLRVGQNRGQYTPQRDQNDKIAQVTPPAGDTVPRGSAVNLTIYAYSDTPPCPTRICYVDPKIEWGRKIEVLGKQPAVRVAPQ